MSKKQPENFKISVRRIVTTDTSAYIGVVNDAGEEKLIEVEEYEHPLLIFHFSDYSNFSHVKTIHQIFHSFLESSEFKVNKATIEHYENGVGYAKVTMQKKGRTIYFGSSIVDAFILCMISDAPIFCKPETWKELAILDTGN